MKLFEAFRNPAKRYARELGPWLRKSFGSSQFYAPGQILRGVKELRLDARFIVFGYAAFLSKADFEETKENLPVQFSYDEARAKFERFITPRTPSSASGGESTITLSDLSGWDVHSN